MSTLVLNSDGNPVSIVPLSTINWKEAIGYMTQDKAVVLEWYDNWVVHSVSWETRVPAVMMLHHYMKPKTAVRFCKSNVFLRDEYRCVYCNIEVNRKTATLDHVLPISHGGRTTFENCVTACGLCNARKGNNKKIVPKFKPYKPNYFQLADKRRRMQFELAHPSWAQYLGLS